MMASSPSLIQYCTSFSPLLTSCYSIAGVHCFGYFRIIVFSLSSSNMNQVTVKTEEEESGILQAYTPSMQLASKFTMFIELVYVSIFLNVVLIQQLEIREKLYFVLFLENKRPCSSCEFGGNRIWCQNLKLWQSRCNLERTNSIHNNDNSVSISRERKTSVRSLLVPSHLVS